MAGLIRRSFGTYQIEELILTNQNTQRSNSNNLNQTTESNAQNTRNVLQRKPLLHDGIYSFLSQLISGTTFEKSSYAGFDYSHLPQLEYLFNKCSDYVHSKFSIATEKIDLTKYEMSSTISVLMPCFVLSIEFTQLKDAVVTRTEQIGDASSSVVTRVTNPERIFVELFTIEDRDDYEISQEEAECEEALINLFKLYIKGFLLHVGQQVNQYDNMLTIDRYRPLLIAVLCYEKLVIQKVQLHPINAIYYTMASFNNYPLNLLRFNLSNIKVIPAIISERIKSKGLFRMIESRKTMVSGSHASYIFVCIDGSEAFLAPKHYKMPRQRVQSNLQSVLTYDYAAMDLKF
jgi:hypothetical protein